MSYSRDSSKDLVWDENSNSYVSESAEPTTIAEAIAAAQQKVANAYTAVSNKGGTLPATQNLANMPAAIESIPSGSSDIGITREVSSTGIYQMPAQSFSFSLPSNATHVGPYAMQYAFYLCTSLTSIDLSSLTTLSDSGAMRYAFYGCTGLTSIDLSRLTTLSGSNAMQYAFYGCTSLTSVDLSSLTTLSGSNAMQYTFYGCTGLTSIDLSGLANLSGSGALQYAFRDCTSLTSISFSALESTSFGSHANQFNNMLQGVTGCTVHFPSNLQSVIGSWSSVTAEFGGTNCEVLFDLPATS